jgi:hypothetical protein
LKNKPCDIDKNKCPYRPTICDGGKTNDGEQIVLKTQQEILMKINVGLIYLLNRTLIVIRGICECP